MTENILGVNKQLFKQCIIALYQTRACTVFLTLQIGTVCKSMVLFENRQAVFACFALLFHSTNSVPCNVKSDSLSCPNFVKISFLVYLLDENSEFFTGGTPNNAF